MVFSPDGCRLAFGCESGIRVWEWTSGWQRELRWSGPANLTSALAFSPDGKDLVSGGQDGAVRYWDPADRKPLPAYRVLPVPVWSPAFAFGPDGKTFVALNRTNRSAPPSIWDTATLREVQKLSFVGTNYSAVAWSPDGRTLALGDWLGNVRIWDLATGRAITNFAIARTFIGVLRFSGQGSSLFCGASSGSVWGSTNYCRVWRVAGWREIQLPAEPLTNAFWAAISPDSSTLAVLDSNRTLSWWDIESGRRQAQFKQGYKREGGYLAFSPDGRTLASSRVEGFVSLWDVVAGRPLATDVRGNADGVWGLAFTPDGQRLLTGGGNEDDVVRLLDVQSKRWVATLPGQNDAFYRLEMSPDGNTLAAVGVGGTSLLWRAPSWAEIEAAEKPSAGP